MSSYNELIALINGCINRNGVQAITGRVLNGVLRAMVNQLGAGYAMGGVAHPTDDPGTPDAPVCYYASEVGTYTHFGNIQIVPGELALLCFDLTDGWFKETMYEGFESVQATIDGNVGTPAVNVTYVNGVLSFDFSNMKGNTGDAAGFGTISADVDANIGTPAVSVSTSGPDTAKVIAFHFRNLKGETGVTSVVATVDNTTGNPACAVSLNGQELHLDFTGLKGAQGNTGVSADYPIAIINNLTDGGAASALSAEMGKELAQQLSQLEHKVDENINIPLTVSSVTPPYETKLIYNESTHQLETTTVEDRQVAYIICNEDSFVKVSGTGTASRKMTVGLTTIVPAAGVYISEAKQYDSSFEMTQFVPAGMYCVVVYHASYNTGRTYAKAIAEKVNDAIAEDRVNIGNLSQGLSDLSKELDKQTNIVVDEASVTPTDVTYLQMNTVTSKLETAAVAQRVASYVYCSAKKRFKVSGLGTADRNVCVGYTDTIPAVDVTVNYPSYFNAQFETVIEVPSGKYLCVVSHQQYNTGMSYKELTMEDLKDIVADLQTDVADLQTDVADLQTDVDALEEDVTKLNTTVFRYTQEEFTPASVQYLQYTTGTGLLSTVATAERYALYKYFTNQTKVRISGEVTNATKPLYIGFTDSIPANGVAMSLEKTEDTASTFTEELIVPAGKYLCVVVNYSYHKYLSFYVLGKETAWSDMGNNTYKKALQAMYDDRIIDVEYSVVGTIPGNTIAHFKNAFLNGFRAMKADMRLTSDNKIVLCHDAGYTFDGNGRIVAYDAGNSTPIHDLDEATILSYEFAQTVGGEYVNPCSLDAFIGFCKKNKVIPYLTFRNEYVSDTATALYNVLRKYKMEDKCIINLFPVNATIVKELLKKKQAWLICDTGYTTTELTESVIDNAYTNGCSYVCIYSDVLSSITEALVLYAAEKNVRVWLWGGNSSVAEFAMGKGVTGFQNYTLNPFE